VGGRQRLKHLLFFDKLRISFEIARANEIDEKTLIGFTTREIAAGSDA
jgi:hypothetical protein